MPYPKRPIMNRVVMLVLFLAGLLFVWAGLGARFWAIAPESQLSYCTDIAKDVTVTEKNGRFRSYLLSFTLDGRRFSYRSSEKGYGLLVHAAKLGVPITVGYSVRRTAFFVKPKHADLYVVSIGKEPILTYDDTLALETSSSTFALVLGAVLLAIPLRVWLRRRRR